MKNALAVMFVMLFAAAAHAQKEAPLPKDLPPYGTQPSFQPPEVKVEKFENGLTLWLVAQPGLPTVSFRIVVLGGLALDPTRSEEHTSELQSPMYLVCRLLLEKKKKEKHINDPSA